MKLYRTENLSREDYTSYILTLVAKNKTEAVEKCNVFLTEHRTDRQEYKLDYVRKEDLEEYEIDSVLYDIFED